MEIRLIQKSGVIRDALNVELNYVFPIFFTFARQGSRRCIPLSGEMTA